jgi:SsrA-binding protein
MKILARNKKASFNYSLLKKYDAGIVLEGNEVKSVKLGNASIKEAFVKFMQGELFLINGHISAYNMANMTNYDPTRSRKLLLNKKEINELNEKVRDGGLTIVPVILFEERGLVKVQISLARGKKKYDKREDMKNKSIEKENRMKQKNRW